MGALRRLARLIWGDDVDPALRPVLGVTLVGTAAGSAMWSFMAIWAVDELGAKARAAVSRFLVGRVLWPGSAASSAATSPTGSAAGG